MRRILVYGIYKLGYRTMHCKMITHFTYFDFTLFRKVASTNIIVLRDERESVLSSSIKSQYRASRKEWPDLAASLRKITK